MEKLKEFVVTINVYTYARNANDALKKVYTDVNYMIDSKTDGDIFGFVNPTIDDAVERIFVD